MHTIPNGTYHLQVDKDDDQILVRVDLDSVLSIDDDGLLICSVNDLLYNKEYIDYIIIPISFEISQYGINEHIAGNTHCDACDSRMNSWRDDHQTPYPIKCDLCGEGLMHSELCYVDDDEGGVQLTGQYLCDKCLEY